MVTSLSTVAFAGYTFLAFGVDVDYASKLRLPEAGVWYAPTTSVPALTPTQDAYARRYSDGSVSVSAASLRATHPVFGEQSVSAAHTSNVVLLRLAPFTKLLVRLVKALSPDDLLERCVVSLVVPADSTEEPPLSPAQPPSVGEGNLWMNSERGCGDGPPGSSPTSAQPGDGDGRLSHDQSRHRVPEGAGSPPVPESLPTNVAVPMSHPSFLPYVVRAPRMSARRGLQPGRAGSGARAGHVSNTAAATSVATRSPTSSPDQLPAELPHAVPSSSSPLNLVALSGVEVLMAGVRHGPGHQGADADDRVQNFHSGRSNIPCRQYRATALAELPSPYSSPVSIKSSHFYWYAVLLAAERVTSGQLAEGSSCDTSHLELAQIGPDVGVSTRPGQSSDEARALVRGCPGCYAKMRVRR